MQTSVKQAVKTRVRAAAERLPPSAAQRVRGAYLAAKSLERRRTERIFEAAPKSPEFLPASSLDELAKSYPPFPEYGYEPDQLKRRGEERAAELLRLPGASQAQSFLELGCWDGMVGWGLQSAGKTAIGIDARSIGFDQRAIDAGVDLRQMDAAKLELPDASVDFSFSYDAFEHFPQPDLVLGELGRVVKPGGSVWMMFGPLYLSPFGEHAYRSIPVPYLQLLWPEETLNEYARRKGVPEIDFSHCNRWRIGQFRDVIHGSPDFEVVRYREALDLDHLDVVRRYPSCFRSKTDTFEDLIVKNVEVLLRRR